MKAWLPWQLRWKPSRVAPNIRNRTGTEGIKNSKPSTWAYIWPNDISTSRSIIKSWEHDSTPQGNTTKSYRSTISIPNLYFGKYSHERHGPLGTTHATRYCHVDLIAYIANIVSREVHQKEKENDAISRVTKLYQLGLNQCRYCKLQDATVQNI